MKVLVCTALPFLLIAASYTHAQHAGAPSAAHTSKTIHSPIQSFTPEQRQKIGSGLLLLDAQKKKAEAQTMNLAVEETYMTVAIYSSHAPSIGEIAALEQLGVRPTPASWIPPLENHPLGFFIAKIPVGKMADVLSNASVVKMDSAENELLPMNNQAAVAVKATLAWAAGYTGSGVKVAVLDSGLDYTLPKTELPDSMWYRNYAFFPDSVNNVVGNSVSGHGTHVTGTVLGRGGYSTSPVLNIGNGGGAYKGMAPDAKLVFLKIGQIQTSGATGAAMAAAIVAAADTFGAKVINLSYGGWDPYHDGSDLTCQATDYAYSKGVACIYAAGNDADAARHYSGTVGAGAYSDFIEVNTSKTSNTDTRLVFNLVWADGSARNDLELLCYDNSQSELSGIVYLAATESSRGTESRYAYSADFIHPGSRTYYLRVRNLSASSQFFHIYEAWGNGNVKFASPDPQYTISFPAFADHALAVGAYTIRQGWRNYAGDSSYYPAFHENLIASFSSRGPRIDGLQKPNITAPGLATISIRDRDVFKVPDVYWIDNDGRVGGDTNYYVMQGTSMASPVVAGGAAILLQHTPSASPRQVYDAIMQTALADSYTGAVPNSSWGYGKLDINAAMTSGALPVNLVSFTSSVLPNGSVVLAWRTATETNNYGFEIERKDHIAVVSDQSIRSSASSWKKIGFVGGEGTTNIPHAYSFTDRSTAAGRYSYRLKQIDRDGRFEYSPEIESRNETIPFQYALGQNYPNPFNPSTTMRFTIAAPGRVRLAVFDILGRETAVLVDKQMEPGAYAAQWNAREIPSGVYFYRLDAGAFSAVRKLLIQK